MSTLNHIEPLANEFIKLLKQYLSEEEFNEVKRRNAIETDKRICHSHDYIDANVVMLEAMKNLNIKIDFESDETFKLIHEAWILAKTQK